MLLRSLLRRSGNGLISEGPVLLQKKKLYTPSHEWIEVDIETKVATIGISKHAQEQFGTVVYVDLPEKGQRIEAEKSCGNVESVKATTDITAPASGLITEVNSQVLENPSLLNDSPEKDGWLLKIENVSLQEESLMGPEKYDGFVETGKR